MSKPASDFAEGIGGIVEFVGACLVFVLSWVSIAVIIGIFIRIVRWAAGW